MTDFAKAALSWRNIDAELAQISSRLEQEDAATTGVHGIATAANTRFPVR